MNLSILVVEDNQVNQKVALFLLKKLGYGADLASNGLEAIAMWKERSYDIILMDVQMPQMDGITAAQEIRKSSGAQPYIIALTADSLLENRQSCIDAGMDDYLGKPILLDQLEQTFRHYQQNYCLS